MTALSIRAFVVVAVAWLGAGNALAGDGRCMDDWSIAGPIVKREGLVTVEQLASRARSKLDGDIVKAVLCEENGGYVFRLLVRKAKGGIERVTVNAKDPFK